MKYTAESRWLFQAAPADEAIRKWFAANGQQFTGIDKRTDHYVLDNTPGKGIKLRDDRLEIKINVHNWEAVTSPEGNYIKANSWKKYSFVLAQGDEEAAEVVRDFAGLRSTGVNTDWVRIDKERLSITFEADVEAGLARQVEGKAMPPQGCSVDYTRLQVNLRSEYLSFGFEAFGDGTKVKKSLDLVMKQVFEQGGISGLPADMAMSYPEFVAKGEWG